ncbi:cytochrome p450 protein [Diplodia corticola]|uniref:Cytochrome p450 protein n=1 Tax=Diplodia corticola TaxID=236234 RepID=A0A1J9QRE8_9PEZI|nr:cytochrome p450 protein [Diplodia corticola]OJD30586.1 cytochrome p450 protein [Diplodia corticola]
MSTEQSQRLQTVHALLDGYGSLSVPTLAAPLADDFKHQVLPESLGMPARDKAAFEQHAAGIFSVFEAFAMVPKAVFEDSERNAVVVSARMQGTLKGGRGEWRNECVMLITLSEDGTRVVAVEEFVDSAKALEMRAKVAPKGFDE